MPTIATVLVQRLQGEAADHQRMEEAVRTLFVISDLHLGGRPHIAAPTADGPPGFQINHSYAALIAFIDWVGKRAMQLPSGDTELVINGDIVDFLAEDDYGPEAGAKIWTADEPEALAKFEHIVQRARAPGPEGAGVFDALKAFAVAGNRLTLLMGNHDVELSLPLVRRRLGELLGEANARVRFIYDGEAYTVGRVLIEHGNRYDRWNMIDFNGLRQERSMRSRGLTVDESLRSDRYFVPPAGSQLVIGVMNRIKARYRFIDLLKPETGAALPLLLALEPDLWQFLVRFMQMAQIADQFAKDGLATATMPKRSGNLSQPVDGAQPTLEDVLTDMLGAQESALFIAAADASGQRKLERPPGELGIMTDLQRGGETASDWLSTRHQWWSETASSLAALLRMRHARLPEQRERQLHAALKCLAERDGSFDIDREDAQYLDAARETAVAGGFDVIIYGHTHLPKKKRIDLSGRPIWYLNTGTWCDVLRLPADIAADFDKARVALARFAGAIGNNNFDEYIQRYLSYVEVRVDPTGQQAVAEPALWSFCGPGKAQSKPLTPMSA